MKYEKRLEQKKYGKQAHEMRRERKERLQRTRVQEQKDKEAGKTAQHNKKGCSKASYSGEGQGQWKIKDE